MGGYENLMVVVYHAGPSIYGCQALKMKVIDMGNKSYPVLHDIDCPISRYSNLIWLGFSEEGQLYTYDNEGVFRGLSLLSLNWTPVLDFKIKFPTSYS